jgi:Sulfotransferase family
LPRSEPAEPRRFFFMHMQKTGGLSLYVRMWRYFGRSAVYPDPSDGDPVAVAPQLMVDTLLERWKARRHEIQMVVGHFPLCTTQLLGSDFTTLTVLRDPVERTLSYLRHHRATTPADSECSLEAIYEDPLRFRHFIQNHMVKMLSLEVDEMTDGMMTRIEFDRGRLRRAKRALRKIDEFGLQEDLEPFARRLERRFHWQLGAPVHENVTRPIAVPGSFRERIAEDNRLDMELYEYGRKLLSRRSRRGR